jgi:two-component system, NarL family, sensor histidine kinase DesK
VTVTGASASAPLTGIAGVPSWTARRSRWFLTALHVPFVAAGPVTTIPRHHLGLGASELLVLIAAAICALQLRHSLAAARGARPVGAPWTLLAICLLVYLPLSLFTWDWGAMQGFVVASAAMILPRCLAPVAVAGVLLGNAIVAGWYTHGDPRNGVGLITVITFYYPIILAMGGIALVGSGWLARALADLDRTQREQADIAAARERVRVSLDLHDLLGQSLTTASLKGDLALSMLPTDRAAARAELEGMAAAARRTLQDIRAVTQDEHTVTIRSELASAVALLGAAGIHTAVDVADVGLARPVEEALAWAVREAATNTLRHSQATRWSVTARHSAGRIRLIVVNDGAMQPQARAGGLAGVAARARALSGHATTHRTTDGQFRLEVEIPEEQR